MSAGQKGQPIPSCDSEDLQEDLSETGMVVHHSTAACGKHCLPTRAIRGKLHQRPQSVW